MAPNLAGDLTVLTGPLTVLTATQRLRLRLGLGARCEIKLGLEFIINCKESTINCK